MKIGKPSLHITILTLFLSFLFVTTGSLTWFNFEENSDAALVIAEELLSEVSKEAGRRIEYLFSSSVHMANEVAELSVLAEKPVFMRHSAQWFLSEALLSHPHIYSVYMGYSDGDFYQLISLRGETVRRQLASPADAELAIRHVFSRPADGRRVELWQFLDEERRLVGSRSVAYSNYDPRNRPWFKRAIHTEGVIHTPFYIFRSTGSMGMTFAHRFDGPVPGVFGVDISLLGLSQYFSSQRVGKSGYVFLFDKNFKLTAHPDPGKMLMVTETPKGKKAVRLSLRDTMDPLMSALAVRLEQEGVGREVVTLSADGKEHLVKVASMTSGSLEPQFLAVVAPVSDFTGTITDTRQKSLIFSAIIILLAIPFAMGNARMISTSLHQLAIEADKIRRFDLNSTVEVKSHIAEIANLSKAVQAMRSSLSSFGRYVPRTLVKRLLLAGEKPELGGQRREATLLFTDIEDFTTISESLDAEELMLIISEYLEVISSTILYEGGTIDKYIGDAVMAFWNAPNTQPDHAKLACNAALMARDASEKLNERLEEQGYPVMKTRFGLHTGRPVIGNVGSKDRMNYTAMGASVNLASRLEGLNKYYQTQILASESVVAQVGEAFIFRPVGKVVPKGVLSAVTVYELMGRMSEDDQAEELLRRKEAWEEGYALYQDRRFDEAAAFFEQWTEARPKDRLAFVMLDRARGMMQSPPGDDWDGVDVFKAK